MKRKKMISLATDFGDEWVSEEFADQIWAQADRIDELEAENARLKAELKVALDDDRLWPAPDQSAAVQDQPADSSGNRG